MADKATLAAAARTELEEMYQGFNDDSVNILTFRDLAQVKPPQPAAKREQEEIYEGINDDFGNLTFGDLAQVKPKPQEAKPVSPRTTFPSLDFDWGFEGISNYHRRRGADDDAVESFRKHLRGPSEDAPNATPRQRHGGGPNYHVGDRESANNSRREGGFRHAAADDMMSPINCSSSRSYRKQGKGRRRPEIPHTKICTTCSCYIYIGRHRCLVCGRAYCSDCVRKGMGEMTEGRKCIECLGRRFSERYIERAGEIGWCVTSKYPARVTEQELKWAEKGPRRSGAQRRHGHGGMMTPNSRTTTMPRTPTRAHLGPATTPPPSIPNSPYPDYDYSPTTIRPLPL